MKKTNAKLAVLRQTVRVLGTSELRNAAAGDGTGDTLSSLIDPKIRANQAPLV